jgi:TetR/AcrR family transcriptional regulator
MTRVLIGDALVNEDERLQLRMNQFYDRVELALKQALRSPPAKARRTKPTPGARRDADQLCDRTLAPLRQERLQNNPSQDAALHITLLLS